MDISRRRMLRALGAIASLMPLRASIAARAVTADPDHGDSNFRYIYDNPKLKQEFHDFLINVFNLYPDDKFHTLIASAVQKHTTDQDIYVDLQNNLKTIKPFLSELTLALPALNKQKHEMAKQTSELLPSEHRFEGYLEVGSSGRYLDALEEQLNIVGERFMVSDRAPTYSIPDIVDRGQGFMSGEYIPLDNYQAAIGKAIPANSIDLATVYIGFHHCPLQLRESFISSIRDAIKPGGYMILRDHNAHNETMWKMVALAHDVFNMGTNESWGYNERELRKFYSLNDLDAMLSKWGFMSDGRRLYQSGDPTLNALMLYRKV